MFYHFYEAIQLVYSLLYFINFRLYLLILSWQLLVPLQHVLNVNLPHAPSHILCWLLSIFEALN
jgi:hypothetical protein